MPSESATSEAPSRRRLLAGIVAAGIGASARPQVARAATTPPQAFRWLSKATFGCTEADLAAFNALGNNDTARWSAWLDQQLAPSSIDDSACDSRIAAGGYTTLGKTLPALWADHHGETDNYALRMLPLAETECATVIRAVTSKRQLFERMVGFWHDHFSVYGADYDIGPIFVSYDRDVIRPNALGNFRSLLGAVARSTAMLFYLDNYASIGANYNENYARELMELHTLGVENYYGPTDPLSVPCLASQDFRCDGSLPAGYVDNDVYEAAAALTGWTIRNGDGRFPNEDDGTFTYHAEWHDHRNKVFLGSYIPANQPAMRDGEDVFDRLCAHPGTARHIAGKLCRRFVGEHASNALIGTVANVFTDQLAATDQIAQMLRVIFESAEYQNSWGDGMRRPLESSLAGLCLLGANFTPKPDATQAWTTSERFFGQLQQAGQRPFRWGPPNGYPDSMEAWASTGALAMTMKLLTWLPEMRQINQDDTSPLVADVVAKTKIRIPAANRTAATIINDWCGRTFGCQPQPLATVVTAFLQQNAAADEVLDLDRDEWHANDLKRHYTQSRLRSAIGLLLASPDFLRR